MSLINEKCLCGCGMPATPEGTAQENYATFKKIQGNKNTNEITLVSGNTYDLRDHVRIYVVNGWETIGGMGRTSHEGVSQALKRIPNYVE